MKFDSLFEIYAKLRVVRSHQFKSTPRRFEQTKSIHFSHSQMPTLHRGRTFATMYQEPGAET
jgi:hypothetical protein